MGHALVASSLPGVDPVQKVSIIPRGVGALGYTMQRPTEDRFLLGESELKNRIAVLMGGRAAEELDVRRRDIDRRRRRPATRHRHRLRDGHPLRHGHDRRSAHLRTNHQQFLVVPQADHIDAAEATAREIDVAIRDLVAQGLERAKRGARPRAARDLEEGATLLLKSETLTVAEFPAIAPQRQEGEQAPTPTIQKSA